MIMEIIMMILNRLLNSYYVIIPFRPITPRYSYPPPCSAPAVPNVKRYRARAWMILLLLDGRVRGEAAPVPHFAPLRPGAGYIALSRRRGSALYTLRL